MIIRLDAWLSTIFWWLWDFLGFRLLWLKAFPNRDSARFGFAPRSFVLWAIGIYIALFGIASSRYESALDRIENRQAGITALLGSNKWKAAIERIPVAQRTTRPLQPQILNPPTVVRSIAGKWVRDLENVATLSHVLVSLKSELRETNLNSVYLIAADLADANLAGSDLRNARLWWANLQRANLEDANLAGADLHRVDLREANLHGADLTRANFTMDIHDSKTTDIPSIYALTRNHHILNTASVEESNRILGDLFEESPSGVTLTLIDYFTSVVNRVDLRGAKGLTCDQLQSAQKWELAYRDEDLACGAAIPQTGEKDQQILWLSGQLGYASPEITLRVYADALKEEEADLSFLDFGGTKRHPGRSRAVATFERSKPPRLARRMGFEKLERETMIDLKLPTESGGRKSAPTSNPFYVSADTTNS